MILLPEFPEAVKKLINKSNFQYIEPNPKTTFSNNILDSYHTGQIPLVYSNWEEGESLFELFSDIYQKLNNADLSVHVYRDIPIGTKMGFLYSEEPCSSNHYKNFTEKQHGVLECFYVDKNSSTVVFSRWDRQPSNKYSKDNYLLEDIVNIYNLFFFEITKKTGSNLYKLKPIPYTK